MFIGRLFFTRGVLMLLSLVVFYGGLVSNLNAGFELRNGGSGRVTLAEEDENGKGLVRVIGNMADLTGSLYVNYETERDEMGPGYAENRFHKYEFLFENPRRKMISIPDRKFLRFFVRSSEYLENPRLGVLDFAKPYLAIQNGLVSLMGIPKIGVGATITKVTAGMDMRFVLGGAYLGLGFSNHFSSAGWRHFITKFSSDSVKFLDLFLVPTVTRDVAPDREANIFIGFADFIIPGLNFSFNGRSLYFFDYDYTSYRNDHIIVRSKNGETFDVEVFRDEVNFAVNFNLPFVETENFSLSFTPGFILSYQFNDLVFRSPFEILPDGSEKKVSIGMEGFVISSGKTKKDAEGNIYYPASVALSVGSDRERSYIVLPFWGDAFPFVAAISHANASANGSYVTTLSKNYYFSFDLDLKYGVLGIYNKSLYDVSFLFAPSEENRKVGSELFNNLSLVLGNRRLSFVLSLSYGIDFSGVADALSVQSGFDSKDVLLDVRNYSINLYKVSSSINLVLFNLGRKRKNSDNVKHQLLIYKM